MPMFWKKSEDIHSKLVFYFDECDKFFGYFEKAMHHWFENGCGPSFEALVEEAHQAEARADDLRRDIELTLYGKSLLPESRGDLLGLLENYDALATAGEKILFDILCKNMPPPHEHRDDMLKLIDQNLKTYFLLRKTVDALINNPRITLHAVKEVDDAESHSDRLERQLICKIYSSPNHDGAQKIELKTLVTAIGNISDLAEHTSDRIGIIAIKRQI